MQIYQKNKISLILEFFICLLFIPIAIIIFAYPRLKKSIKIDCQIYGKKKYKINIYFNSETHLFIRIFELMPFVFIRKLDLCGPSRYLVTNKSISPFTEQQLQIRAPGILNNNLIRKITLTPKRDPEKTDQAYLTQNKFTTDLKILTSFSYV